MAKCHAWREGNQGFEPFSYDRCYATKEREACECLGNEAFCDFYPEKRKAATQPKCGEWNSVKDNPPGMAYRLVYVFTTNTIEIAKYKGTLWRTRGRRVIHSDEVKYWAPLPEPPKE